MKPSVYISLSMLGILLFSYPLLALFNLPITIFGVPALYVYLFGVWLLVILILVYIQQKTLIK
jgi:hypothetical protein